MSFLGRLPSMECIAPSNPDIPVLKDQREEFRADGGHNVEVVEVVLSLIEWGCIDVRTTEHISDAKAGTVPEIIDCVNALPGHSA